jgi:DTW domain-containing protein YfiP
LTKTISKSEKKTNINSAKGPSNTAVAYGIANYFIYSGERQRSDELLQLIVSEPSWSALALLPPRLISLTRDFRA